jgi:hypothetical protein
LIVSIKRAWERLLRCRAAARRQGRLHCRTVQGEGQLYHRIVVLRRGVRVCSEFGTDDRARRGRDSDWLLPMAVGRPTYPFGEGCRGGWAADFAWVRSRICRVRSRVFREAWVSNSAGLLGRNGAWECGFLIVGSWVRVRFMDWGVGWGVGWAALPDADGRVRRGCRACSSRLFRVGYRCRWRAMRRRRASRRER